MTGRGFVGPLIMLTIGFILLFNNIGMIPWDIWTRLWHYWPVILILIGIETIFCCGESKTAYIMAMLLGTIVIIGAVMLANSGVPQSEYNSNMKGADLSSKDLAGWDMNFADLGKANLSYSKLDGANLNFANLKGVNLNNATLDGANLNFANLENSNLGNADLNGANLNFASLKGANMAGAIMDGANLFAAGTSVSTICPDSRPGPCW